MYFDKPFNGDKYIEKTFLKLKNRYNIKNIVETGTFEGGTTVFLSQNFDKVFSIECNFEFYSKALINIKNANTSPCLLLGNSEDVLPLIREELNNNTIFYLDAHWYENCPLKKELSLIKEFNLKPIIAIHDFYVPGSSTLGYDSYNNQPFTYDWLKDDFDNIYDKKYSYFYNNDLYSDGAKRGIIYIIPNN